MADDPQRTDGGRSTTYTGARDDNSDKANGSTVRCEPDGKIEIDQQGRRRVLRGPA